MQSTYWFRTSPLNKIVSGIINIRRVSLGSHLNGAQIHGGRGPTLALKGLGRLDMALGHEVVHDEPVSKRG